jgi:hypothetical protein
MPHKSFHADFIFHSFDFFTCAACGFWGSKGGSPCPSLYPIFLAQKVGDKRTGLRTGPT